MQLITTLAMCLTLLAAVTCSAADGALRTNAIAGRTTVAVLRCLPEEPALMDPRDAHWLRTFSGLVASDLRQVASLRVLPESAVLRELARQKTAEPYNTNAVTGIRKLGENLRAEWVIMGALARTGSVWTASAYVVEAAPGKFGKRLGASSTNWFELRDLVVRQVLQRLNIAPSTEEQKLMGRAWTSSAKALEWFSQAASDPEADAEQKAVHLS